MTPTDVVPEVRRITYDDGTVRGFVWASVIWGLVGMLVGLLAALQLSSPSLNVDGAPWLTFSRIRPLHTNAVIFALVGNMMFAGVYYSTQRLLKTRMASDALSKVHLWGWQLIILGAALTLPFGITQSKEYAELEWFLDIAVVLVWVAFAVNFFWTLKIRNERNLYVAIWFYISTVITIAVLYIVNNLAVPVSWDKSYGVFAGAQDALTQWWYGHNAVAFFLTTPILGIMYYFLPKAAGRPVYSYRLSIVHFWALIFIYIWAGPHHLLYTALPDWAQSLGMLFSLMLWAPSWGGMLNGLLTLRGAWHKVRTDPVLKFFVAAVTFYGMATFEGPLLSIKSVSALGHYSDWIIGHVHNGALGWNGFMAAGMFYWLVPRLFGTKLHSTRMADFHFWIGTFGILIYVGAMWVGGITQGLIAREFEDGGLKYQWVEVVAQIIPMYWLRSVGGTMYIVGWILMTYNLFRTARAGKRVNQEAEVTVMRPLAQPEPGYTFGRLVFGGPTIITVLGLGAGAMMMMDNMVAGVVGGVLLVFFLAVGAAMIVATKQSGYRFHSVIESRPLAFTVLVTLAVLLGGLVELLPGIVIRKEVPLTASGEMAVKPYTPLELEGRDVYVSEGCYVCHSQMIRPFYDEKVRFGDPSLIEESMWDRPFQWGSKRTGPDLARLGSYSGGNPKWNNQWHYKHMVAPSEMSPGSNMPAYPHLATELVNVENTEQKLRTNAGLGVPYTEEEMTSAKTLYRAQADEIVQDLSTAEIAVEWNSEIVALIAYLQRLGRNELPGLTPPVKK